MIKFENVKVNGFEEAVRGIRMYNNSLDKFDSHKTFIEDPQTLEQAEYSFVLGSRDSDLLDCFATCGTSHENCLKMINVYTDICAPLYWWREFCSYDYGAVTNEYGIMYRFREKDFKSSDFSYDHLIEENEGELLQLIDILNEWRKKYMDADAEDRRKYWWQIMQLLPASYNQSRMVKFSYWTLKKLYNMHKTATDEWVDICKWIETLPYAYLITGGPKED